jgi:hypothetical protein
LADEEHFYNFTIQDEEHPKHIKAKKEEENKEANSLKKKPLTEKPILERVRMWGSLRKTCSHSVKAIFTKDQKHFYAVRRGNMDVEEGLAMYESKNIFNPDKNGNVQSSFLSGCQVGNKSFIDYSFSNTRISYMKDINTIEIIPLLNENTLSFFSMPERE